ncbi:hypothetical protein OF83DRAFT_1083718 [Amylostereum chailletii]|nr:hypothetical protein OF83DRAFT_1083718 [Amylostereum chailletii]
MDYLKIFSPMPTKPLLCAYNDTLRLPAVDAPSTKLPRSRRPKKKPTTYSLPPRLAPAHMPYVLGLLQSYKLLSTDDIEIKSMLLAQAAAAGTYPYSMAPYTLSGAVPVHRSQNSLRITGPENGNAEDCCPHPTKEVVIWSSSPSPSATPTSPASSRPVSTPPPSLPTATLSSRIAQNYLTPYRLGIYHRLLSPLLTLNDTHILFGSGSEHEHGSSSEHALMFVNTLVHPCAPSTSGAPGLMFRLGDEAKTAGKEPKMVELMVRVETDEEGWSVFRYFGRYELVLIEQPSMALEEWRSLSSHCREKWVQRAKKCGGETHERIRAFEQEQAAPVGGLVSQKLSGASPATQAIRRAFDEGRETLNVVGLRCVGYTDALARRIKAHVEAR